jgi:hypothetical protein
MPLTKKENYKQRINDQPLRVLDPEPTVSLYSQGKSWEDTRSALNLSRTGNPVDKFAKFLPR